MKGFLLLISSFPRILFFSCSSWLFKTPRWFSIPWIIFLLDIIPLTPCLHTSLHSQSVFFLLFLTFLNPSLMFYTLNHLFLIIIDIIPLTPCLHTSLHSTSVLISLFSMFLDNLNLHEFTRYFPIFSTFFYVFSPLVSSFLHFSNIPLCAFLFLDHQFQWPVHVNRQSMPTASQLAALLLPSRTSSLLRLFLWNGFSFFLFPKILESFIRFLLGFAHAAKSSGWELRTNQPLSL